MASGGGLNVRQEYMAFENHLFDLFNYIEAVFALNPKGK